MQGRRIIEIQVEKRRVGVALDLAWGREVASAVESTAQSAGWQSVLVRGRGFHPPGQDSFLPSEPLNPWIGVADNEVLTRKEHQRLGLSIQPGLPRFHELSIDHDREAVMSPSLVCVWSDHNPKHGYGLLRDTTAFVFVDDLKSLMDACGAWLRHLDQRSYSDRAALSLLRAVVEHAVDAINRLIEEAEQYRSRIAELELELDNLRDMVNALGRSVKPSDPDRPTVLHLAKAAGRGVGRIATALAITGGIIQGGVAVEQHQRWTAEDGAAVVQAAADHSAAAVAHSNTFPYGTTGIGELCASAAARCQVVVETVEGMGEETAARTGGR